MSVPSAAGLRRGALGLILTVILILWPAAARAQDPAGTAPESTASASPWYQQNLGQRAGFDVDLLQFQQAPLAHEPVPRL